jgi:hypothetical protein
MKQLNRRSYLQAAATVPLVGALAGCSGGGDTGTLATYVSDQPGDIADFDTLLIQVSAVYVKPAEEDRQIISADAEVDLTELVGEASDLVDETELESGDYEFLQLQAEATEATLADGGSATVELSGDAPLTFEQAFEIRSGETTRFTADFTPVKQGQTGRYTLQPVADEVDVSYGTETEA